MAHNLTFTAFLSMLILISGSLKIPSPIIGGEFQLSAPIAVLICCYFGFRRYLLAGIMASILSLLLGTATVFNVLIAMIFRLVAGSVITLGSRSLLIIALSGPLGTLAARMVMGQIINVDWQILAAAAVPGMIFTALVSVLLYKPCQRFLAKIPLTQKFLYQ